MVVHDTGIGDLHSVLLQELATSKFYWLVKNCLIKSMVKNGYLRLFFEYRNNLLLMKTLFLDHLKLYTLNPVLLALLLPEMQCSET